MKSDIRSVVHQNIWHLKFYLNKVSHTHYLTSATCVMFQALRLFLQAVCCFFITILSINCILFCKKTCLNEDITMKGPHK